MRPRQRNREPVVTAGMRVVPRSESPVLTRTGLFVFGAGALADSRTRRIMSTKTLPATYDPRQVEMARYKTWMAAGYFHAAVDPSRQPFVIMLPLPNVNGQVDIGHASPFSIQDVLI